MEILIIKFTDSTSLVASFWDEMIAEHSDDPLVMKMFTKFVNSNLLSSSKVKIQFDGIQKN